MVAKSDKTESILQIPKTATRQAQASLEKTVDLRSVPITEEDNADHVRIVSSPISAKITKCRVQNVGPNHTRSRTLI